MKYKLLILSAETRVETKEKKRVSPMLQAVSNSLIHSDFNLSNKFSPNIAYLLTRCQKISPVPKFLLILQILLRFFFFLISNSNLHSWEQIWSGMTTALERVSGVAEFKYVYWELPGVDFPGGSDGKVSAHNAGDPGSIPGSGRFPGEGNGNPLQYSCLENSMDRGAW